MSSSGNRGNDEYRALCDIYSVPVFHQPWWLDTVCDEWIGVVAEGESGIAIWPVPVEKKLGVGITRNPALTAYLGPVLLTQAGYSVELPDTLLSELLRSLPSLPVWHIAALHGKWQSDIFQSKNFEVGSRPTYLLGLEGKSEAELFAGLSSEMRRKLRRSSERIIIQNEPEAAEEMFALQMTTLKRKAANAYHTAPYFSKLVTTANSHDAGALWTARSDGHLLGAQWSVWDKHCCYNMGLARNEMLADKLAATALLWHAITAARSRGLALFDFEGSSIPTIAEFFASFGGKRASYLTLQKNSSLIWRAVRALRS